MSKRVSHSLLDPLIMPMVPGLYRSLCIPRWFPPEGIVLIGHLLGIAGAIGFAYSSWSWVGGFVAALGVGGNHAADMVDGTHARSTDQCRNGGELLDHFTDPLSFSYWAIGLGVSCGRLDLALAGVVCIYATAVLTNIKAKLMGEFTLARFGPTEFKAILIVWGLTISVMNLTAVSGVPAKAALWFYTMLVSVGVIQLLINLVRAVRAVNRAATPPDTTAWQLGQPSASDTAE